MEGFKQIAQLYQDTTSPLRPFGLSASEAIRGGAPLLCRQCIMTNSPARLFGGLSGLALRHIQSDTPC